MRNRTGRLIMLWAIMATPLLFWRASYDSFEAPKTLALALAGFWAAGFHLPAAGFPPAAGWPLLLFVAVAAASSFGSPIPLTAWFGEYTSYQGTLHLLALAALAVAASRWLADSRERRRALAAAVASLSLVSVYAVLQLLGADPVPWAVEGPVLRSFSTAGNAYFLGSLLAPGVPMAACLAATAGSRRRQWSWAAFAALILAGLLSSGSRSALAAAVLGCLPLTAFLRKELLRPLAAAVVIPVVLCAVALPADRDPFPLLAKRFADVVRGDDARPQIWLEALRLIRQRPLLGHGPDTFATLSLKVQTPKLWGYLWRAAPEKAHDEILQLGATVGLLGLGTLLWIAAILARLAIRQRRDPEAAAAAGGLTALTFVALFGFLTCGPQAIGAVLAGVLFSRLPARPVPRAAIAPLAVLLGLSLAAHLWFAASEVALKRAVSRQGVGIADALTLRTPWAQRLLRAGDTLERLWLGGTVGGGAPTSFDPRRLEVLRRIYGNALTANPLHPFAYSDLGRLAAREGRFTEANELYRKARELDPMDAYLALEHAQALLAAGRDADAVSVLNEAAALYPGFAEPVGLIGYAMLRKGRLRDAEPWLKRSLDMDWHGNAGAAYAAAGNLSVIYRRLNRPEEAAWAANQAERFMREVPR